MTPATLDTEPLHTLAVVLFPIAQGQAAIEAARVGGLSTLSSSDSVASMEMLIGLRPHQPQGLRQQLKLKTAGESSGAPFQVAWVSAPVDLLDLPVEDIHPLPTLLAARHGLTGLRALAWRQANGDASLVLLFEPLLAPSGEGSLI